MNIMAQGQVGLFTFRLLFRTVDVLSSFGVGQHACVKAEIKITPVEARSASYSLDNPGKAWWFVLWGNMKTLSSKTFGQSPSATRENPQADQPPFMPNILVVDFIGNKHFWRSRVEPKLSIVQVAQLRNRKIIEQFSSSGKGQAVPDDEDDQYSDSTENAEEETGPASAPTTDETAKLGQKQQFFSQAWNAMSTIFWAGGLGIHL